MIEIIQTILALIVTISILVTVHEYGHYWVARLCGVHVVRFSVGFGKPIFIKRGKAPEPSAVQHPGEPVPIHTRANEPLQGTEFAIAAIPLGGYVKMLDEREGFVPDDQLHLTFNRKTIWQRIAIVLAGPIANFLLAVLFYWAMFATGVTAVVPLLGNIGPDSEAAAAGLRQGQEIVAIDGIKTPTWQDVNMRLFDRLGETGELVITAREPADDDITHDYRINLSDWLSDQSMPNPARALGLVLQSAHVPAVIGGLNEDGRARAAGIEAGDQIIVADGRLVDGWGAFVEIIQAAPEETISLTVIREGREVIIDVTPAAVDREGARAGFIGAWAQPAGIPDDMLRETRYPVYSAWMPALQKTWDITAFTLDSIGKLIVGGISPGNLNGPITIARVANASVENGFESFISFLALLSISLGVINLLPIPMLDGGHLLYYLIELITRRPVPERVQMWGMQVGVLLLVGIMLLAFYNDITRL